MLRAFFVAFDGNAVQHSHRVDGGLPGHDSPAESPMGQGQTTKKNL
jgi:hypothetical protein